MIGTVLKHLDGRVFLIIGERYVYGSVGYEPARDLYVYTREDNKIRMSSKDFFRRNLLSKTMRIL